MTYTTEDFELLEVSTLREMLDMHFKKMGEKMNAAAEATASLNNSSISNSRYSLMRVIDDFVLLCVLVGNDFLPHIPHLDIENGSINFMMSMYQELMPIMGGYLTDKAKIHLPRLELFLQYISSREPLYFEQRGTDEQNNAYKNASQYRRQYYMVFDFYDLFLIFSLFYRKNLILM
jgi:5'-3' exonuclease